ncbi:MAG: hypothetical protein ASARMPRED_000064 [Alectoria sarmentosa]|nr:MAG: hypothetical protein ASARMPRED_000064 [Alectoria sarmentosa]
MFLYHVFSFLSLCAVAILAKPLQITSGNAPRQSVSANLIDAAFASDVSISTSASNTSAQNSMSIDCNGALYGFNPNIADCQGAAQAIVPDIGQTIWGERHTGLPGDVFPLPFAVFGDKAECVIRTVIHGDGLTARASLSQVKIAATALSLQCAAGGQSEGGIATNIGGDNNLAVTLSTYKPNIQCGRAETFTHTASCGALLENMPASAAKVLFGPERVPGVQEPLPQLITSGDACLLRLFSTGRADYASWYSIWGAAEATFARFAERNATALENDQRECAGIVNKATEDK